MRTPENEKQDSDNKLRVLMVAKDFDSTSMQGFVTTASKHRRQAADQAPNYKVLQGKSESLDKSLGDPMGN